jgi:hypothetical protein
MEWSSHSVCGIGHPLTPKARPTSAHRLIQCSVRMLRSGSAKRSTQSLLQVRKRLLRLLKLPSLRLRAIFRLAQSREDDRVPHAHPIAHNE